MKLPLVPALALILAASCLSAPAFALSDESSHYSNQGAQTQLADPDEKTGFDDGTQQAGQLSGREQTLLGSPDNIPQTSAFDSRMSGYGGYSFGGGSAYVGGSGYSRR